MKSLPADDKELCSWSIFHAFREKVRVRYPSVYGLPVKKKLLDIVIEKLEKGHKVLDVGASNRRLGEKIISSVPSVTFRTMDIDRARDHDYYSLEGIDETFDIIILSEVIEHIGFEEGISMLRRLHELLNRHGRIIVSTPNLHHPNRYWDFDHRTPYRYDDIGAALLYAGFELDELFRIYNDQFIKRFFRIHFASRIHAYLDIDFAKSIIAVASKK